MLRAEEFMVGTLADAAPGSLMLPRNRYEAVFLIGGPTDAAVAVCLSPAHPYAPIKCAEATAWRGIIIPNIVIEMDPMFMLTGDEGRAGALIRSGSSLHILTASHQSMRATPTVLLTDLPPAVDGEAAVFLRWQVVLGGGVSKRVLWSSPEAT